MLQSKTARWRRLGSLTGKPSTTPMPRASPRSSTSCRRSSRSPRSVTVAVETKARGRHSGPDELPYPGREGPHQASAGGLSRGDRKAERMHSLLRRRHRHNGLGRQCRHRQAVRASQRESSGRPGAQHLDKRRQRHDRSGDCGWSHLRCGGLGWSRR